MTDEQHPQPAKRCGRSDRGAVMVLTAIALPVLLLMTSFAIDLGRQRSARRDMQAKADVIALDLVRLITPSSTVTGITGSGAYATALSGSLSRNNVPVEKVIAVQWGHLNAAKKFETVCAGCHPEAVRVVTHDSVDYFFQAGKDKTVTRDAVALMATDRSATFSLGSKLAGLDTKTPSVLNPLLTQLLHTTSPVNLTLVGYQGLAAAFVDMDTLAANLGFGSPDALAHANPVALKGLIQASADALEPGNPAKVTLNNLALQTPPTFNVNMGQLFDFEDGGQAAAANAKLNAFDLIMAAGQLANRNQFLTIPVGVTIPGVTGTTLRIRVTEAPKIATGPDRRGTDGKWITQATTAQVEVQLDSTLTVAGVARLVLPIRLGAAEGHGDLTLINCGATPDTGTARIEVSTSGVTATAATDLQLLGLINVGLLNTSATIAPSGPTPLTFTVPPTPTASQTTDATGLGLGTALVNNLNLGGLALPVGTILGALTPLTSQIDSLILEPLFESLGLTLAGADVRTLGLDCAVPTPQLVG